MLRALTPRPKAIGSPTWSPASPPGGCANLAAPAARSWSTCGRTPPPPMWKTSRCCEQVIADFAAEDLLLVVEFLTYALPGEDSPAYAAAIPELIEGGSKLCLDLGLESAENPLSPARPRPAPTSPRCAAMCRGPCCRRASIMPPSSVRWKPRWQTAHLASSQGGRLWKDCISLDRAVTATDWTNHRRSRACANCRRSSARHMPRG